MVITSPSAVCAEYDGCLIVYVGNLILKQASCAKFEQQIAYSHQCTATFSRQLTFCSIKIIDIWKWEINKLPLNENDNLSIIFPHIFDMTDFCMAVQSVMASDGYLSRVSTKS